MGEGDEGEKGTGIKEGGGEWGSAVMDNTSQNVRHFTLRVLVPVL